MVQAVCVEEGEREGGKKRRRRRRRKEEGGKGSGEGEREIL